jgi:choline kinase
MRAIILAAGRGSRLHPYTADCPKCLTELGGETLIDRQLKVLRTCGVKDITIVTGYRAEMLNLPGTTQVINDAWATTNMVESLFVAEDLFDDDLIVSYSDIVYEHRVLNQLLNSTAETSVIVDKGWRSYWEFRFDDPLSDAESLRMNEHGEITDIGSKVTSIDEIEAQYIGLMRFNANGIRAMKSARCSMQENDRPWKYSRPVEKAYMTDLLMEMVLTGSKLNAVPVQNGWLEIDTISDFETADTRFTDGSIVEFFDPDSDISSPSRD